MSELAEWEQVSTKDIASYVAKLEAQIAALTKERDAANQRAETNHDSLQKALAASKSKDPIIADLNEKIRRLLTERASARELADHLLDERDAARQDVGRLRAALENTVEEFDHAISPIWHSYEVADRIREIIAALDAAGALAAESSRQRPAPEVK